MKLMSGEEFALLSDSFLADMREGVDQVLAGSLEEYSNPFITVRDVASYIIKLGGNRLNIETNGWEADMWVSMEFYGKFYTIEGSAYSGGVKIGKSDPDEEGEEDDNY